MTKQNYHDFLPDNYFGEVYAKVLNSLNSRENVCVSAMIGCGGKTFANYFVSKFSRSHPSTKIFLFDPEVSPLNIIDFTKAKLTSKLPQTIIIVKAFNKIANKDQVLEKLSGLQQSVSKKVVFLMITDHTGVTNPLQYFAKTSVFFANFYSLKPFTLKETIGEIEINNSYYGWHITPGLFLQIYQLSGGIPRLIKYICKDVAETNGNLNKPNSFLNNPIIRFEIESLTKLVIGFDSELLYKLGLTDENGQLKSQLLKQYIFSYSSEFINRTYPELSQMELKIVSLLFESKNTVVPLEKIEDFFNIGGLATSQWAIYKLVSRINKKLKPNLVITNLKGRGYIIKI